VGLEHSEEGVQLKFETSAGPRVVAARAAVGCDGVNSVVRKHFYPDETLNFEGINTWRGVTWREPILGGRTYIRIGSIRTGKLVVYPIAERADGLQLINWVAEVKSDTAAPNDWNRPVDAMAMPEVYRSWTFDWLDVPALLTRAETIFEYPMVDRNPVAQWSFGAVTLMGDAAHPMYPRGSNGAAHRCAHAGGKDARRGRRRRRLQGL
jgi:2-polyprenyl-6-methoxyphenol hydroxylase-like FAD-dependent oxidoreductase